MIPNQANIQAVMNVAFARMLSTKFKPGKREEALKILDDSPKEKVEGFMGILAFLHEDDPDSATIISVWDSKETLDSSAKGIFKNIMDDTEDLREATPDVKSGKVREMRGQLVPIKA